MSREGAFSAIRNEWVSIHVKVWEEFMGVEVPFDDNGKRFVIHHLDQNPNNNDILNLVCMTDFEHRRWHNKNLSKETLEKKRVSMIGKNHAEETKLKISESHKGKKHTEESKLKTSEAMKGKKHTEETKLKMSEAKKGKKKRIVVCPFCKKSGGCGNMKRYHFDNCKMR